MNLAGSSATSTSKAGKVIANSTSKHGMDWAGTPMTGSAEGHFMSQRCAFRSWERSSRANCRPTWCEYLEAHARKVFAGELNPDLKVAHLLADKIKSGAIENGMQVRDIYRPQWAGLTRPDVVWAGLEQLKAHNFLRVTQKETGGRQADVIEINPATRRKAA